MSANLVPQRDRAVSVARLDGALTLQRLRAHFVGREAYRRTRYVVVWSESGVAVARVERADQEALFAPITQLDVLAEPGECVWLDAPEVDTTVPTQLQRVARERAPTVRCAVARGRYAHVNFILEPQPNVIRVVDVVPPTPAKLLDQAEHLIDVADDLPPVTLRPHVVDVRELTATHPADCYLFPCRGGGAVAGNAEAAYLDERPPRRDWVMVGCAHSRELHQWFYGDLPETVELCPRAHVPGDRRPTLVKCCLVESGTEQAPDGAVTVPWGATNQEVRRGIDQALEFHELGWAPG